ncbi:MAG: porin family protein [Bacteroidota bacterium]
MKQLLISFAFLMASFFATAQGFSIGPKLGANITGLNGLQFQDGYNVAYHFGVFAEVKLGDHIGLQPELLWNQTSYKTTSGLSGLYASLPSNANLKLNYISIPVLLNIKPTKLTSLQAGPQFGILANASNSTAQNIKDAFKKGDVSMLLGVQLKLLSFRVYGRYGIGLTSINDIVSSESWKSRTLQLGVGLGF